MHQRRSERMSLIQCFLSVDFNRVEKVSRTLDILGREEEIGMSYQENVWQRTVRLGELKPTSHLLFMLMSPFMNAFEYIKFFKCLNYSQD